MGIAFIGPTAEQMRAFGLKHTARAMATKAKIPLLPGTGLLSGLPAARRAAKKIGYPVMLKSTAGGGGIGMRRCDDSKQLGAVFEAVGRLGPRQLRRRRRLPGEAGRSGPPRRGADLRRRHAGACWRWASATARCSGGNQKVVEETPPPGLSADTCAAISAAAVRIGEAARYRSAGTVEFIVDPNAGQGTTRATSTFWRSTPASRSSTASPKR